MRLTSEQGRPANNASAGAVLAASPPEALLDRLQQAHEAVLEALATMEAATARSRPDPASYVPARLALSKASRARRVAFRALCDALARLPSGQHPGLDRLMIDDARSAMRSHEHVRFWTREAIQSDWQGYRKASAEIRRAMRERLVGERQVLFPTASPSARSIAN